MTATDASDAGCRCCGDDRRAKVITGHERQLPSADPVTQRYGVCGGCGTWYAIDTEPTLDLAAHYPSQYYSFDSTPDSALMRALRGARARHAMLSHAPAGWLVTRMTGLPDDLAAMARMRVPRTARLLDVGAGGGRLLRDLHAAGFTHVEGCDKFGAEVPGPPRLHRGGIDTVPGTWDVISYHHCLEHIDDPLAELQLARARLSPGGRVLVRVPLADSDAATTYGDRWVQLDAPRHRVIPSAAGMAALAARAGLTLITQWRDSSAFQFWGSELYRRDIPLRSVHAGPSAHFTRDELRRWAAQATALNASGRGDQGAFILQRAD